ncbi:HDR040Cp [Eremothecium sinecaudum]|uniref:glucan endo-1,3-beta-D-glucosidase n=1 Tax=Eremothecium sinecaudum TaxID=45286 RepID=A0A0X8HSN5_9SACH|nr:HDR040Cp [Eremothecium sinecaudum]AMD20782.1 HDR040Cp [Eremothecium sinecaudum]
MKFVKVISLSLFSLGRTIAVCENSGGNFFCDTTNAVIFSNVGYQGSYQDVVSMDEKTGECIQKPVTFSGGMAPLNEEMSVHIKGPLKLHEFSVYYPTAGGSFSKREETVEKKHNHEKKRDLKVVEVVHTIYVDSEGRIITGLGAKPTPVVEHDGKPSVPQGGNAEPKKDDKKSEPKKSEPKKDDAKSDVKAEDIEKSGKKENSKPAKVNNQSNPKSTTTTSYRLASATDAADSSNLGPAVWKRVSHYTPGSTTNCTFFNHHGGSGSGVWSSAFGNSISYASADGRSAAKSPTALGDVTLKSNEELIIFSGVSCDDTSIGDCGYHRDNIPAHHGFGGDFKILMFEFTMPHDNSGSGDNQDMPAIWMLNAKIPRTLQYGKATCSCWKTGCGELDLFEILNSGSDKLIAHVHSGQGDNGNVYGGGGSQDYFTRPTTQSMKAAVIFAGDSKQIHIVKVDGDFGDTLSSETVMSWLSQEGSLALLST